MLLNAKYLGPYEEQFYPLEQFFVKFKSFLLISYFVNMRLPEHPIARDSMSLIGPLVLRNNDNLSS